MRILIQRVSEAGVSIKGETVGAIGQGLLILVGVEEADTMEDVQWLAKKAVQLRIFNDVNGVMNRSVTDVDGEILIVSQFTLYAATAKGNRPSYIRAAKAEISIPLYEAFCREVESMSGKKVQTGRFGADMKVQLCNDGPVTIWIDSKNRNY